MDSTLDCIQAPLLVIGGGNMGRAIVEGASGAGVIDPARVVVVEPEPSQQGVFAALRVRCEASLAGGMGRLGELESAWGTGAVLLAIKPQVLAAVAGELSGALRRRTRLVLSIMAGVPTSRLSAEVGGRVVRLMPNTPAKIRQGITAMCAGPGAGAGDLALARRLFEAVGAVIDLPEDLLDAFTGVAGSGPAYVFYLAEAMAAGAEAVGFSPGQASEIVRATIVGAAGLLGAEEDVEPAQLRARVTSKGGTTAAAVGVLDERRVLETVRDAIVAARDRGRELAGGSSR